MEEAYRKIRNGMIIFGIVVVLLIAGYLIYQHNSEGTASFSEEFLATFDLHSLNNMQVYQKAQASNYYRVFPEDADRFMSWSLHLPITDEFIMTLDMNLGLEMLDIPVTYKIEWYRQAIGEPRSSFQERGKKMKYACAASIDTPFEYLYIQTYGNDVEECVQRIEEVLLKMYNDLVVYEEKNDDYLASVFASV